MFLRQKGFVFSGVDGAEEIDISKVFDVHGSGKKPPEDPPVKPPRNWGLPPSNEPPRRQTIRSSKGYSEVRDPAADGPSGVMKADLDAASLHKLRQSYGPALVR